MIPMTVKCTNNEGKENLLTVDKEYIALNIVAGCYVIKVNDIGARGLLCSIKYFK